MKYCIACIFFICHSLSGQQVRLLTLANEAPATTNFRSLSVINDRIAWVSGSNGWFGITRDGAKHWTFQQIKGFEKLDFRTLYAFDDKTAIAANAGSPAYVLRTQDGGLNWRVVYQNDSKDAFLDGVDFWNETDGLIYGDPIQSKMVILRTNDAGVTWQELDEKNRPVLAEGEASFAASGTGIRCLPNGKVVIATGGKTSRLWVSNNKGLSWDFVRPPVIQGGVMTGIYSVACDNKTLIVVGGDYEKDTLATDHVFYSSDFGKTWQKPQAPTGGIRECVEFIGDSLLVAAGFPGIDMSVDSGQVWRLLYSGRDLHVVRKARNGSLILAAGNAGQLMQLTLRP